jgi:hypothetical protein
MKKVTVQLVHNVQAAVVQFLSDRTLVEKDRWIVIPLDVCSKQAEIALSQPNTSAYENVAYLVKATYLQMVECATGQGVRVSIYINQWFEVSGSNQDTSIFPHHLLFILFGNSVHRSGK